MPKQPTTRENNPARQPRARGGGAFDALVQGTVEGVAQYSPEGPRILRDQSQSDRLIVGQTYGGPQGQSTWTQLAQLLQGGMQAAEGGVKAYAVVQDNIKRADAKSDAEVQREYELRMGLLTSGEDYQKMEAPQQLEERRKLHDVFKDRFVTDEAKHTWRINGFRQKLEVQSTNAEAWYAQNVNDQIREINMNDALSDEMKANMVADVIDAALDVADKKFVDNPNIRRTILDKLVASDETADKQVTSAARGLLADYQPKIANAMSDIITDINNGVNIYAAYPGADRNTAFSLEMSKRAGIDLDQLEPQYGARVIAEMRDEYEQLIERNYQQVVKAENQQVIERGMNRIEAEQASLSNLDRPLGPTSADGLIGAINALERNTFVGPHTLTEAKLGALETIMNRYAQDPRMDWTPQDREQHARELIEKVAGDFGYDRADGTEASKNFFERLDAKFSQVNFDLIEASFVNKDAKTLMVMAESTGNENAFKIGFEPIAVQASDLIAESMFKQMGTVMTTFSMTGDPLPASVTSEQGQRNMQSAMRVALIGAARGEDFHDVLVEELGQFGIIDPRVSSVIENYAATSGAAELLLAADLHKEGRTRDAAAMVLKFVEDNGSGEDRGFDRTGGIEGAFQKRTDLEMYSGDIQKESSWSRRTSIIHDQFRLAGGEPNAPDTYTNDGKDFDADFRGYVEFLMQDSNLLGSLNSVANNREVLQSRVKQLLETRYGAAPPAIVTANLIDTFQQGGPSNDDAATFYREMGSSYREHVNRPYVERVRSKFPKTVLNNVDDNIIFEIGMNLKPESMLSEEEVAAELAKRGLQFTRSKQNNINGVAPMPFDHNVILSSVDSGNVNQAQANGLWLKDARDWLENSDSLDSSYVAMRHVVDMLGTDDIRANNAGFYTAAGVEGVEPEDWATFKECVFGGNLNNMNIRQSRFMLAVGLMESGIPISEWNPEAFRAIQSSEGAITRSSRGTLIIDVANVEGPDYNLVIDNEFVRPYDASLPEYTQDMRTSEEKASKFLEAQASGIAIPDGLTYETDTRNRYMREFNTMRGKIENAQENGIEVPKKELARYEQLKKKLGL